MLPTFVIGLREGLEASLIVGIIAAFLIQRERRSALRAMWIGVGAAVALCLSIAVAAQWAGTDLPERQREGMTSVLSLVAVCAVSYMIVWMRRHARELRRSVESSAEAALAGATSRTIVGMAFVAVLREGLETAVFLLATFKASTSPRASAAGAVLGLAASVVLGYAIYKGGVKIDLGRFFRLTGFVLVLVAAGLMASAVEAASGAGWISSLGGPAMNLGSIVAPGSILGAALSGMFGVRPQPTWAEVAAWLVYAIPMGAYVLWPHRHSPAPQRGDLLQTSG
jgi:high-affinity iron transporter